MKPALLFLLAALLASCSAAAPHKKAVLYLRKDGTFASAGDSFKERW